MIYDEYRDSYEAELDRAVGFSGRSHAYFTEAKATRLRRLAATHLGDVSNIDALDVGCGVGLTDQYLSGRFGSLTGVDIAPGVLERAEQRNPWARYVLYDGTRLPFEDGSFDLTFVVCVVQVLEPSERQRFVAELGRVTHPAGLVVAFEHNPFNPLTRLVVRRAAFGHDAQMLPRSRLETLFRRAGLDEVEGGYMLFSPWAALSGLEERLAPLPLGAQYYLAARGAGS